MLNAGSTQPSETSFRILVADDQPAVLDAIKLLLRSESIHADTVQSPQLLLEYLSLHDYDAVLIDLNYARDTTSGREGLEVLEQIREMDNRLPVIVMTAWGTIDLAVSALRRGARDFVQKPWDDERLLTTLKTQAELYRSVRQRERLEAENRLMRAQRNTTFIAEAPTMRPIVAALAQVGPTLASVLIRGEHGSGKEVVAQLLHSLSLRAEKPLIAVNTGALPEGTFESELFGHVKGAFTDARADRIGRFEMADGGTLFLDEIGNIPLRQQAKLLRVLETGEVEPVGSSRIRKVDVRVLAATNADLKAACEAGHFREDLLFRLNTVEIVIPPLRERREDIPRLTAYFLNKYAKRYGKEIDGLSNSAMERLMEHAWPGNVRELNHTIERAVIMCRERLIDAADLGLPSRKLRGPEVSEMSLEDMEAMLVGKALARFGGNVSQAANALGLTRGTFYRRMQKYGFYASASSKKET
jgi:DNA-binding NtrC family response regulator